MECPPPPPPPPPSFSLLSCFLNACQESLMAVEFGQEKSGAGSFRGSGDLCLTKAAPLFVFSQAAREKETDRESERQRKSVREALFQRPAPALGGLREEEGATSDGPPSFNLAYTSARIEQYGDTLPDTHPHTHAHTQIFSHDAEHVHTLGIQDANTHTHTHTTHGRMHHRTPFTSRPPELKRDLQLSSTSHPASCFSLSCRQY